MRKRFDLTKKKSVDKNGENDYVSVSYEIVDAVSTFESRIRFNEEKPT